MSPKIATAPFAVGSDGTVFVNLAHVRGDVAAVKLIREARRMDGVLFLGISVTGAEKDVLIRALDNAGAEAVAKMVGLRLREQKQQGRRPSSRGSR
ncbi:MULTISPECIES: hypothetical protein [Sorangium]|uniref:Uncharacterized protein n=1 Tax=Sorangium cellulosum TaxID=56 RepID=A0A4P2R3N8_SORCE|nr:MULTISPECIES: hypothetical protein [Sorangium]AUX37650.1 uncharacterized protein SOCE836_098800 [Sorangium cellulosum]WCQ96940.1 hypothetical protein NQZ70_09730 [Sorangium sp. Soce836]